MRRGREPSFARSCSFRLQKSKTLSLSLSLSRKFLNQKIKVRGMGSSMTESFPPLQDVMLEFRAGRMFTEGTRVIPDTRKGLVRIGRGEEGLVHFQWLDRTHNVVEDDQIVFPDEAVFEKVNQSSERVYILKFSTDSRRFFYWMQDPKSDGDTQICSSVNYYINQSLDLVGEEDVATSVPQQMSDMAEDMAEDDISRDGNLAEQHLATELISEVNSSSGLVQLEDLQRILSNISAPDAAVEDQDGGLGLNDILKPDLLMPLLETLPLEQRLVSHLPEGPWTPADFIELLQSPPFRQQVEAFTYVLRTGQIDLSQFGIDPSKYKFTVLSFLEALEDSVLKAMESGEAESRADENKDLPSQRCSGSDPMDEGQ